jgi:hypothetical protein
MIPKLIHQLYIGPKAMSERDAAWCQEMKRMNPTWKYTLRGNDLLDEFGNDPYMKHLLATKAAWAFISDRIRMLLLVKYGGVYLDTDAKPLKPLDSLNFWDSDVDFVYGMRNPYRPGVALHRGVGFGDNTFLASAQDGRMVNLLLDLWRPTEPCVTGHRVGLGIFTHADASCRGLNYRYFYDMNPGPEAIVSHDSHNSGSWVTEHRTLPFVTEGETIKPNAALQK